MSKYLNKPLAAANMAGLYAICTMSHGWGVAALVNASLTS